MSGGGGTQEVYNKTDPWVGAQPYIKQALASAQQRYGSAGPEMFPSTMTTPLSPETIAGQRQIVDMSTGPGQQFGEAALQSAAFNVGAGRDPNSNPYFQSALQGAIRPVFQQLQDSGGPLQSIRSGALLSGQYGGNRQGIAEGLALSRATQQAFDTTAALSAGEYGNAQQRALQTAIGGQAIQQGAVQPGVNLDAVGQQNRAYQQALLDEQVQRWNYEQQLPDMKLDQYLNRVSGNYGGSSTGTVPSNRTSPITAGLGGALAGGALGTMLYGASVGGPWGAGIGAVIGLLGGM